MHLRFAALAASVIGLAVAFPVAAADRPILDNAFQRVASTHPELRLFGPGRSGLSAELDRASLRPALVEGARVETAFDTGAASDVRGVVALASTPIGARSAARQKCPLLS